MAWLALPVLGALAGAALIQSRRLSPPPEPITFEITAPSGDTFTSNPASTISADGQQLLLYAGGQGVRELWIHSLTTGTARRLPQTAGATFPFWSPDGRTVGFFADGRLKKIETSGTAPAVDLCAAAIGRGGTWNARNEIVFANVDGPLMKIAAVGGAPTPLTRMDAARGDVSHIRPQFLPDGRHVLYTAVGAATTVRIVSLDDPARDEAVGLDGVALYSAGHLVFHRRGSLLAQPFDPGTRTLSGEPITVVQRTGGGSSRSQLVAFSASASGTLSYGTYVPAMSRLTWFDRSGNRLSTVGEADEYVTLSLSPDDHRLAVSKGNESSVAASLWVFELAGGSALRITRGDHHDMLARWSADSQRLAFSSEGDEPFNVVKGVTADGSSEPEILSKPGVANWLNDWSPDGQSVLLALDSKDTNGDLWSLPMSGDRTPKPFLKTPSYESGGAFSPDGRWVAYGATASGRSEVYIRAFPDASGQRQVSINGGVNPVWRKDGRELFFIAPDQTLMSAAVNGNDVGEVKPLFKLPSPSAATGRWHQYTVNGDGSRVVAIIPEAHTRPPSITVIANWPGLLSARP